MKAGRWTSSPTRCSTAGRIRALTVVDNFSRESLAIEVGQGITGEQVVAVMNRVVAVRGAPKTIRVDNGPEFVSRALDQWAYLHQVTLDFSRPGKPTDNALVESFNSGRCLGPRHGRPNGQRWRARTRSRLAEPAR